MKAFLWFVCIVAIILVIIIGFSKDAIFKVAIEQAVKYTTGLKVDIDSVKVNLLVGQEIHINGLRVYNPPAFEEKILVDIPEIYAHFDLSSLFSPIKKVYELKLYVKKFIVVINERREVNLDALKFVKKEKATAEQRMRKLSNKSKPFVSFDEVWIRIDDIILKDYRVAPPEEKVFSINIREAFDHVDSLDSLSRLIVIKAVASSAISEFVGFNINILKNTVGEILKTERELLEGVFNVLNDEEMAGLPMVDGE